MNVPLEITEISQGRDAEFGETGERNYSRVFRLRYDVAVPGPGQAIIDQIIKYYDIYQEPGGFVDERALAISGSSQPEEPDVSFSHLVTIRYSTKFWDAIERGQLSGGTGLAGAPPHGGGGQKPDDSSPANPLAHPAKYSWGAMSYRQVLEFDHNPLFIGGVPVQNRAGVPFNPPYETERELLTLTVERNVLDFDPLFARDYFCTVNADDIMIKQRTYSAGSVLLKTWTADSQEPMNGVYYWTERLFMIFKLGRIIPNSDTEERERWKLVLLNAGMKQKKSGQLVPIVRPGGYPENEPWPLDNNGAALAAGYTNTQLVYLTFVEFPPKDFSYLRLDG